jgi:biofilm PGA synthesis N-glycosyltransferase PgaC
MKKTKLTIIIPAYNEEANIFLLMKSLLKQKRDNFILDKILVISDGSTDNTVDEARKVKSNLVEVRLFKKRHGKGYVLNHVFRSIKSEIAVLVDADVVIKANDFIVKLIKPFYGDVSVGMVGALALPLEGGNFTEKAINCSCFAYLEAAQNIRGGNNLYSVSGRAIAYRRKLLLKVKIPLGMIGIDAYTYFFCIKEGFKYKFAKNAKVFYRSPSTIGEHIRQNTRFLARTKKNMKYFSKELVQRESHISYKVLGAAMLKQFINNPILSSYIFLVNKYCQLRVYWSDDDTKGAWDIARSTKVLGR